MKRRRATATLIAMLLLPAMPGMVAAGEPVTFILEMKDGIVTPERLDIPANTQVKIVIRNTGSTPVEFESLRLRKEKVLAPGVESFVVIRKASPGEYPFFDDFHPETGQGVIVAR